MSACWISAGVLLVPLYRYYVRDRSGVYCRQHMVSGIVSSSVFRAGALMAYGINYLPVFLKWLIYRIFLWTGRSLGLMPARLGRQTAPLGMKRWVVPKVDLVVRLTRFAMPWGCRSSSF